MYLRLQREPEYSYQRYILISEIKPRLYGGREVLRKWSSTYLCPYISYGAYFNSKNIYQYRYLSLPKLEINVKIWHLHHIPNKSYQRHIKYRDIRSVLGLPITVTRQMCCNMSVLLLPGRITRIKYHPTTWDIFSRYAACMYFINACFTAC